jgi:cell division GTPase FtsZ
MSAVIFEFAPTITVMVVSVGDVGRNAVKQMALDHVGEVEFPCCNIAGQSAFDTH